MEHRTVPLSRGEIQMLANRAGVRKIAVINFLSSFNSSLSYYDNYQNLLMDARLYGWSVATQQSIRRGLEIAYGLKSHDDVFLRKTLA